MLHHTDAAWGHEQIERAALEVVDEIRRTWFAGGDRELSPRQDPPCRS